MISWYLALGGSSFSLGSDAHSIDYYGFYFGETLTLLEKYNISKVTIFEQQKQKELTLDSLRK